MSAKINGVDLCPFCGDELEYDVDEKTWILNCPSCGRPMLLCDKCYTMTNGDRPCGDCPHQKKVEELIKKWEKKQVGRKVYWNDPDDETCSCECTVIKVDDCVWTLDDGKGGIIEAYDDELDFNY